MHGHNSGSCMFLCFMLINGCQMIEVVSSESDFHAWCVTSKVISLRLTIIAFFYLLFIFGFVPKCFPFWIQKVINAMSKEWLEDSSNKLEQLIWITTVNSYRKLLIMTEIITQSWL